MLKVITPTRIDLSGGTLDIYPLYLFPYPKVYRTINMAINLTNEVSLEPLPTNQIIIESNDLKEKVVFQSLQDLKEKLHGHSLELILKAIYFFKASGIKLVLTSKAPRGSGLGNSSSLLIAVLVLLNQYLKTRYNENEIITIAQGLETSTLKILTGRQDYYAAMFGGVNLIEYGLLKDNHWKLSLNSEFLTKLTTNSGLYYLGEPQRFRNPRENPNWDIVKRAIEGGTSYVLEKLNEVSTRMLYALQNNDYEAFLEALKDETTFRLKLSAKILPEKTRKLLQNVTYFKICGAGGGGMIWIFNPPPELPLLKFSINNDGAVIEKVS